MEILAARFLAGPNIWSSQAVFEARVRAGEPEPVRELAARLQACLPWLSEHPPAKSSAELLAQAALALQSQCSRSPFDVCTAQSIRSGEYWIAFSAEESALASACLAAARACCLAAERQERFDCGAALRDLRALAEEVCFGRATGPLVAAARARGIPVRRLDCESLVQLGHGAAQRRLRTSTTDRTSKIADWLSTDKELTKRLLSEIGLPVPQGRAATSAEDAWAAAQEIGLPVAIKPRDADYARGVSLNLNTREEVFAAFAAAREYKDDVLVERFIRGSQHRLTVVAGKFVAASRRDPPRVVGDGVHTIAELIAELNLDPRRGEALHLPLDYVQPDDDTPQMLAEQGCTLASILPAGREVVLSRIAHTWAGAGYIDCTDEVHPLVAAAVVSAVKLIGLDVAGVDVIAEDIGRPLEEQQGAILEVNSEPSIAIHFPPLCESHRPVCEAIIESLFPSPSQGRIPIVCITGAGDLAAAGAEVARLLRESGRSVGQASVTGLYLNDRRLKPGDQANLAGTRALLLCPEVEVAVIERTPESVRTEGLGFDACDAAIVLAPEAIHDPELQRAVDVVREASEKSYVASELDPLVLGVIAALCENRHVYLTC